MEKQATRCTLTCQTASVAQRESSRGVAPADECAREAACLCSYEGDVCLAMPPGMNPHGGTRSQNSGGIAAEGVAVLPLQRLQSGSSPGPNPGSGATLQEPQADSPASVSLSDAGQRHAAAGTEAGLGSNSSLQPAVSNVDSAGAGCGGDSCTHAGAPSGRRGPGPASAPRRRLVTVSAVAAVVAAASAADTAPCNTNSDGLAGVFAGTVDAAVEAAPGGPCRPGPLGQAANGGGGSKGGGGGEGGGPSGNGAAAEELETEPEGDLQATASGRLGVQWMAGHTSLQANRMSRSGEAGVPVTGTLTDGSHGSWVDTVTMWSAVQRNGQEAQKRALAEMPRPSLAGMDLGAAPRRFMQRVRTQLVVMARVVCKDPATIIVPAFLLVCLLAFGLWGVFSVAYTIRDGRRQSALNAAMDFSATLRSHIEVTVAPASTVKTLIQLDPEWSSINRTFHSVAPSLVKKGRETDAILTIVLAPQGIVRAIVPTGLPAWEQVYGLDLLQNKSWRGDALKTVALHDEGLVMTGPSRLRAGMMGIVIRYAVFIQGGGPNETWGAPGLAYNCSPCYEPPTPTSASESFWGFSQLNVDWEVLIRNTSRMYDLCTRDNLFFNMTYIDPVTGVNRSIAECGVVGPSPVFVNISTMQNSWILAVSDARGWTPDWLPLVVAVVVVVSMWVAGAMSVIMINRREHMWLLQAMLPKKVIATLRRGEDYAEAFECVTVLFSDIVSYTTIASAMEPIKVVRLLNEMYSEFDALVDQYECYKVETIGDAFMAVCGTQGEDPVAAAVKMARLATAMVERTRVLVSADGQKIQIRIGMHSGPVVGAVVGFKMPHFCLCGDTVNTASRMESNSRPMGIHISDVTAQLLLQDPTAGFRLETRGPIDIKGKGRMLTHWLRPPADELPDGTGGGGGAAGPNGRSSGSGLAMRKVASAADATEAAARVDYTRSADGVLYGAGARRYGNALLDGAAGEGGSGGVGCGAGSGRGLQCFLFKSNSDAGGGGPAAASPSGAASGSGRGVGVSSSGRGVGVSSSGIGSGKFRRGAVDLRLFQHGSSSRKQNV